MTEDQYELLNKFPKDKSYLSEKQLEENCYNDASYEEITDGYYQLDRPHWIEGGIPQPGLRITDKGLKALFDYEEKVKRDKEIEELNYKKLKHDVRISERVVKTYWLTQLITWITFFLAIFLGYLQLAQAAKLWPYHK